MLVAMGIDVGLSSVKVGVFDTGGKIVRLVERPNNSLRARVERVELDADQLWRIVSNCTRDAMRGLPAHYRLGAVGLCGHGNGMYALHPDGSCLATSSTDTRAQNMIDQWQHNGLAAQMKAVAGGYPWAGQPLAILTANGLPPDARIGFCKDWLRWKLTGQWATDRGDASAGGLLNMQTGDWATALFDAVGLNDLVSRLPTLCDWGDVTGTITAEAASTTALPEGVVVAAGSIDLALGALGDGLMNDDSLHVTAGTWAIHQHRTNIPVFPANVLQTIVGPWDQAYLVVESSPTSAINLRKLESWLRDRVDYAAWNHYVCEIDALGDLPIYLPYPCGAWDLPGVRSGFVDRHEPVSDEVMVCAVYEGIAMGHRRQIEKYTSHGFAIKKLIVTGGLTRSAGWCQLLADHTGLVVEVAISPHAACWGAAMCGLTAVNVSAQCNLAARQVVEPRPNCRQRCNEQYRRFIEILTTKSGQGV